MSNSDMTLTQAWEKLRALGDKKPAYSIAEANKSGYFDFLSKNDVWYHLSSKGGGKYSISEIKGTGSFQGRRF